MDCSESRLAEFLAGELSPEDAERVDAHLLTCEACWRAVREDRAGRAALELLATPAPPGLAERVRWALELEADGASATTGWRRHTLRRRIVAGALAGAVALAAAGGGIALFSGAGDPPQVAALTAMAAAERGAPADPGGSYMRLGGERLLVRSFRVEGVTTLVAVATRPFPMPPASHVAAGSSPGAWMATRDGVGLYCVNARAGSHSMLVAATMPAVELPGVLARLKLG